MTDYTGEDPPHISNIPIFDGGQLRGVLNILSSTFVGSTGAASNRFNDPTSYGTDESTAGLEPDPMGSHPGIEPGSKEKSWWYLLSIMYTKLTIFRVPLIGKVVVCAGWFVK